MIRRRFLLVWVVVCAGMPAAASGAHDVAFWREIVRQGYAPPPGGTVPALADELVTLLASPDPEMRDDIAYSTLANWIYRRRILDAPAMGAIADRLIGNLSAGIGERDTNSVLRRSFSALVLSVLVARDNADPWLDEKGWRRIESAARTYLLAEQDVRGYDEQTGWMHSAAHTADLLTFIARSRRLDAEGQTRLLDAVGRKLAEAPVVFTFGEDERLARALAAVVVRADFNAGAFTAWLARATPALSDRPRLVELRARQNFKNTLAKLDVRLSIEPTPSDASHTAQLAIRAALKPLF